MLFKLFRTNHPIVYLYLLVVAFLLKGSFIIFPQEVPSDVSSIAGNWLFSLLNEWGNYRVIHIFTILLTYFEAIFLNEVLIRHRIFEQRSRMPAYIFLVVSSLFPSMIILSPVMVSFIFVILFLNRMLEIPNRDISVEALFFMALNISLASMIFLPSGYLLILVFIGIIYLKSPHWREFLIIFFGFLIPYFFVGMGFYLAGDLEQFFSGIYLTISKQPHLLPRGIVILGTTVYILILLVAGYFKALQMPQQNVILYRKYLVMFMIYIFGGLITMLFIDSHKIAFLFIFMAPLTLFINAFFERERVHFLHRVMFMVLLALVIFNQYMYLTGSN